MEGGRIGSLVVGNTLLIPDWGIQEVHQINQEHWLTLVNHQPEVIIIGTGEKIVIPQPALYKTAIDAGIGVEFMDSGAACRTYNILLSEDRSVIAGIILP